MVVAQAPSRLSLLGGGTDVGQYQKEQGGLVLNLAINLRQHILLSPGSSCSFPEGGSLNFYRTFLKEFGCWPMQFKAEFDGEITGGIGSSASAAVAIIGAISKFKNLGMTKDQIAERAWDIEVNTLGIFGGKQDQYAAAYGGLNAMEFKDKVTVTQLNPSLIDPLLPYLMLFHTPNRRNPAIQERLKDITPAQKQALDFIKQSVVTGVEYLSDKRIDDFALLLKSCWEAKKISNQVTTPKVDSLYRKALRLGAKAGKLMGSGGGGYMWFIVDPDHQYDFKQKFISPEVTWVDFSPDWQGLETRII